MTPAMLIAIGTLIAQLGPLGLELFLKLEGSLNLTPDEKANVANAIASADTADQDVVTKVAAWMQANGYKQQTTFVVANPQGASQ